MERLSIGRLDRTGLRARFIRAATAACMLGLTSTPALATSETNKTISHVGAQAGSAYVIFTVPPVAGCTFDDVYLDVTTDAGRSYYALLLSAYAAGRPLSRIDYTKGADGTCHVDLVEM